MTRYWDVYVIRHTSNDVDVVRNVPTRLLAQAMAEGLQRLGGRLLKGMAHHTTAGYLVAEPAREVAK